MKRLAVIALLFSLSSSVVATDAREACADAEANITDTAEASLQECRKDAESGNPNSEMGYALILINGYNRTAKPKEAIEWFRRAAKHGYFLAPFALGLYLTDVQAPAEVRNLVEGYAWWVFGNVSGARVTELKNRLSPSELAAGEQLAKEFAAKYGASSHVAPNPSINSDAAR